nr:hypothetical protein [Tanacetum cinerariifolium]GEZ67106.1 hypothetical protein [Tanacetum cinerariifolium]GEZ67108.1 hypothetical protein [Tanacetum cinerariifolium]
RPISLKLLGLAHFWFGRIVEVGEGVYPLDKRVKTYTRRWAVSTSSGGVSTASKMISTTEEAVSTIGTSMPVSTAGMVYKGKGIMKESESDVTKTKRQQEIERLGLETAMRLQEEVHKAAQTFTKEEWENIRARVEVDEEQTQRLQEVERNTYSEVDQAKMLVGLINKKDILLNKSLKQRGKTL